MQLSGVSQGFLKPVPGEGTEPLSAEAGVSSSSGVPAEKRVGIRDIVELTNRDRIEELQNMDRMIRRFVRELQTISGSVGGVVPQFDYTIGPDGRQYAVDGRVSASATEFPRDPEDLADEARILRRLRQTISAPSAVDAKLDFKARELEMEAKKAREQEQAAGTSLYNMAGLRAPFSTKPLLTLAA